MKRFSLVLLALACAKEEAQPSKAPQKPLFEQWNLVEVRGKHSGFSHWIVKKVSGGYLLTDSTELHLAMMGTPKDVVNVLEARLDTAFRLKSFVFQMRTGDQYLKEEANIQGSKLVIQATDGTGRLIIKEYPWDSTGQLQQTWAIGLALGFRFPEKFLLYDPTTFSLDTARAAYSDTLAYYDYMGARTTVRLARGKVLAQSLPLDITHRLSTEAEATAPVSDRVDFLRTFSIEPSGKPLPPRPKLVKYALREVAPNLDLEFKGVQELLERSDGYAVVLVHGDGKGPETQLSLQEREELTAPTSFMQANDPRIKALADSITAGLTDDWDKAKAICDWVFTHLEKKATVTVPSAREVLEMGYGDCNEHSILYGALARAAGIPTVVLAGLVYQMGRFWWHAWNASYINGRWVPVDPIGGQFPADAGHIVLKVAEIERQSELLSVVGKLKIEVLEAR